MSSNISIITAELVPEALRMDATGGLFGMHFPLKLEPAIYKFAEYLSTEYNGGYWHFYALSNGGFYMAPDDDQPFQVNSANGCEGKLSADAFGIAVCLFAYSHLSFAEGDFGELCARHYHWLREYVMGHAEAAGVLAAID